MYHRKAPCFFVVGLAKALLLLLVASAMGAFVVVVQQPPPLRLVATIPLPEVRGRIDHFGIDLRGQRLFMSALGNDTVEVFDLRTNTRLHTIVGLAEPQGLAYVPDANRIFVANGNDGAVRIFDGGAYALTGTVALGSDADDTRYDAASGRLYVGYGEGGIAVLDPRKGKQVGDIKTPVHPEAFEVESGGGRIFVNLPEAGEIGVASGRDYALNAHWKLQGFASNFPMALDAAHHRLFVVTRRPAQFLALDAGSGRVVAHLEASGDADDIWYDAARRQIYVSGGDGSISVIQQQNADQYQVLARIPTATGARTSIFVPELGKLFLAVPRRGNQAAELRVYSVSTP